jgi:hypothetical protein
MPKVFEWSKTEDLKVLENPEVVSPLADDITMPMLTCSESTFRPIRFGTAVQAQDPLD